MSTTPQHSAPTDTEGMSPEEQIRNTKLEWGFLASGPWIGGLVFCVIFSIATYFLGDWQMNRRMEVLEEVNKVIDNYDAEPVPYDEMETMFDDFDESAKWTPVVIEGTYATDETLLVRNRPRAGNVGYEVLVPFDVSNGDRVLINRGWVPIGEGAGDVGEVPDPPAGEVAIVARLVPEEDTIDRGAPEGQVPSINLATINKQLDEPVATSAYGRMATENPTPDTRPEQLPEPERDEGPHLSYSLQWFTFGIMSFGVWAYMARLRAVQNREDKVYGRTQEQGYMSAQRIPRAKAQKRRRDGSKTDEQIEDEMLGY